MNNTIPLGKDVNYPSHLDRNVLAAVSRSEIRDLLDSNAVPKMKGSDHWQCFELACLDESGRPKIFCLSFSIPFSSNNIPESKSLKLYLGSLANHRFSCPEALLKEISEALEDKLGVTIENQSLSAPSEWPTKLKNNFALVEPIDALVNSSSTNSDAGEPKNYRIQTEAELVSRSHLFHSFRAVCPVTSQPDYGSIVVSYRGNEIVPESLANYFNSFRNSSGFHEFWAEKMFCEILRDSGCEELLLQIFFARRGGISINPLRHTQGFYSSTPLPKLFR